MFPSNAFAEPIAPSGVQELYWRAEIFGGEAAGLPPHIEQQWGGTPHGLRDVYREGLAIVDAVAQARAGSAFVDLSAELQDGLLAVLDQRDVFPADPVRGRSFLDVVIRHTIDWCFAAPEYGGNEGGTGWRMIGIEGDSQPLGYSRYHRATETLVERPEHPLSKPNPNEIAEDGSLAPRALSGATRVFLAPCDTLLRDPPDSRHARGTLRMGENTATSVTNPRGRFHDVDNLYACHSSVFPTSSGYNPTLTIIATALKIAHETASS